MITQIFSGKNDKERRSTVIGADDKPTIIASLLECDSLIRDVSEIELNSDSYSS